MPPRLPDRPKKPKQPGGPPEGSTPTAGHRLTDGFDGGENHSPIFVSLGLGVLRSGWRLGGLAFPVCYATESGGL